jgi:hypothetical protein
VTSLDAVKNVVTMGGNAVWPLPVISDIKNVPEQFATLTFDRIPVVFAGATIGMLAVGGGASIPAGFLGAIVATLLLYASAPLGVM